MQKRGHTYAHFVLLFLLLAPSIGSCARRDDGAAGATSVGTLTLALPVSDWWTAAPYILPPGNARFQRHGLDLKTIEVNSGLASKNAVIAGTADIGISAATPLALAAANREQIVVLATYLRSSTVIGLVRRSGGQEGSRPPEPVAIVPSTISQSYLYHYLARAGDQRLVETGQLKQLHLRPAGVPSALRSGSAKSAVIWEPFLSLSAEQPGFVIDRNLPGFEVKLYLITRAEVLKQKGAAIDAFLRGVEDASRYIRDHPNEAREQIERHFKFRTGFLRPAWPGVEYRVGFNRAAMASEITREARVAQSLGSITSVPDIEYLLPSQGRVQPSATDQ